MDQRWLRSVCTPFVCGIVLVSAAAAASGCGGDGGGDIACRYEGRSSGCNNAVFGPWQAGCTDFPAWNYDNPSRACLDAYPATDIHCQASCCVSFEFRNVEPTPGTCPLD